MRQPVGRHFVGCRVAYSSSECGGRLLLYNISRSTAHEIKGVNRSSPPVTALKRLLYTIQSYRPRPVVIHC